MPSDDPLARERLRQEAARERERMRVDGRIREREIATEGRILQQQTQFEARQSESQRRDGQRRDDAERRHRERMDAKARRHYDAQREREQRQAEQEDAMKYAADKRQETALTIADNKQDTALALAENNSDTALRLAELKQRADLQYLDAQQSGDVAKMEAAHKLQRDLLRFEHELFLERENVLEQGRRFEADRDKARSRDVAEFDRDAALLATEDEAFLKTVDMYSRLIELAKAHKQDLERIRLEAELRAVEDERNFRLDIARRSHETDEILREESGMVDIRDRERALIHDATRRHLDKK